MSDRWKTTTIEECLASSFAGEWGGDPVPGNAVVYRATDIDDDGRIVGVGVARRLPVGKLTSKMLKTGDILLEGSGGGPGKPVGRVAYFDSEAHGGPATCSNFFKTLRPARDHVDPRFLLQKLFWFYKQPPILALQQQTTGIINLKFEEYLASQIEIPELVLEQAKIAEILDTLDTAIHQTEALIAKLKAVKQGLLHDLLTRGIDANGELRPPQSEAPHLYKPSSLGLIPAGWDTKCISELLADLDPSMRSGPFGSALLKHELVDDGFPLLGIDNVHTERFASDYARFVTPMKFAQLARYAVRPDDLMITIMGTVGRCCLVPGNIGHALSSKHTWTITLDHDAYSPYLAMLQINYSPWVLAHFARDQQGGTMAAIRSDTLRSTLLPVPPREEQRLMEQRLRTLTERIESEATSLTKRRAEKAGLMDDLLTGRVRVTPLLDAAAA
ncbi:restriction endonuclease subunit S [Xanthomonas axonopodis pv. ricini]|uniref:restriction endonuclease subunit S n=1 Tax=Xanthomonas euvesicatoria TaxID=456327 RepID=UPI0024549FEA|nr:restriction endonuclease subunit S [Xanthomonas euvesicatoria]MDH4907162.1 restriction endonuclease subunit S [Xanthomonas euvesicatoria]